MSFLVPSVIHNRGVKRQVSGGGKPSPLAKPTAKPTANAVKKKKPSHVAKKDAMTGEMESLWRLDTEDNIAVLDALEALNGEALNANGRSDVKETRLSHWHTVMEKITRMFDRHFDRLVRHECGRVGGDSKSITDQLSFMMNTLHEKHKEEPIEPDWIRWAFSKLLLSLTGKIVYDKIGADICSQLMSLLQLLKDDKAETADLLRTLIGQMHALTQQEKSISLTRPTVPLQLRVEIQMDLKNGCETVILLTLVDALIVHTHFDFASLPAKSPASSGRRVAGGHEAVHMMRTHFYKIYPQVAAEWPASRLLRSVFVAHCTSALHAIVRRNEYDRIRVRSGRSSRGQHPHRSDGRRNYARRLQHSLQSGRDAQSAGERALPSHTQLRGRLRPDGRGGNVEKVGRGDAGGDACERGDTSHGDAGVHLRPTHRIRRGTRPAEQEHDCGQEGGGEDEDCGERRAGDDQEPPRGSHSDAQIDQETLTDEEDEC